MKKEEIYLKIIDLCNEYKEVNEAILFLADDDSKAQIASIAKLEIINDILSEIKNFKSGGD